ncbi:MAG: hypothetical protein ACE5IG_03080 [Dehalococcoidia bacterium]
MSSAWELALLAQQGLTAGFSAFNAYHFLNYPRVQRGRRWGALTLALVNLAFLVQSLYIGLLPSLLSLDWSVVVLANTRLRLLTGLLPLAASALITLLILRWRWRRR